MKLPILRIALVSVMVSMVTLFACKSDEADPTPVSTAGQYLTLHPGSKWEYIEKDSGFINSIVVLDSARTAFAKTYLAFKSSYRGYNSKNYYAYKNGNYFILIPGNGSADQELIYLKDSTALGTKWSATATINSASLLHEYEVVETNLNKTVNGLSFSNVVHVRLKIVSTGYVGDFYYAPNAGLIKSDEVIASVNYGYELKSYQLK
jgi:hypothetical protein